MNSLLSTLQENPEYLLALLSLFFLLLHALQRYPVYRLSPHLLRTETAGSPLPPLSVVITTHGNGNIRRESLEAILRQDYPQFEVIVVNDAGTGQNTDLLQLMEQQYPQLSHTFIPASSRAVSVPKLAITLGIRRAHHEWVILTEADCMPASPLWLKEMAVGCRDGKDLVIGYANYANPEDYFEKKITFHRLVEQLRYLRAIGGRERGCAVGGTVSNLALRRSKFMENKGFYRNQLFLGGEDLFLVGDMASRGHCAAVVSPQAHVSQEVPTLHHTWHMRQLFQADAARHLAAPARRERLWWALGSWAYYAFLLAALALTFTLTTKGFFIPALSALLLPAAEAILAWRILHASAQTLNANAGLFRLSDHRLFQPLRNFFHKMEALHHHRDMKRGL